MYINIMCTKYIYKLRIKEIFMKIKKCTMQSILDIIIVFIIKIRIRITLKLHLSYHYKSYVSILSF